MKIVLAIVEDDGETHTILTRSDVLAEPARFFVKEKGKEESFMKKLGNLLLITGMIVESGDLTVNTVNRPEDTGFVITQVQDKDG